MIFNKWLINILMNFNYSRKLLIVLNLMIKILNEIYIQKLTLLEVVFVFEILKNL